MAGTRGTIPATRSTVELLTRLRSRTAWLGVHVVLPLLAVALLYLALTPQAWPYRRTSPAAVSVSGAVGVVLAIATWYVYVVLCSRQLPQILARDIEVDPVPDLPPSQGADVPAHAIDADLLLAWALAHPTKVRSRVVENVTIHEDVLHHRVSTQYSFRLSRPHHRRLDALRRGTPSEHRPGIDGPMVLPVTRRPKGLLIDNWSVTDNDGHSLTTLPHHQQVDQLLALCERLITLPSDLPKKDQEEFRSLTRDVVVREPGVASAALAKVQEFLDRVPHTMEPDGPGLIPLLTVLAHCHPILALVDVPSEHPEGDVTVLIKHEMTEARQLDQFTFVNSSFTTRARQWLHGFILTSSSIITVPAHKGLSCDSYHLRVTAPDGFLVVAQEVVERDPRAVRSGWRDRARASAVWAVPQDPDPSSSPYVRPANIQFQPYAHLYARRLREKSVRIPRTSKHTHVRDPYFVVMIGERLPGSLGRALAAAFTAFATIWVIGVHGVGDDVAKQTDLVALVLAAPAFTATWIGLSSRRERSFTSLAGRLSTLLSIALSLTAVLAYLSDPDPNRDHHEPLPAFAWVDHWQWHLLAVASLLNVGWMLSCLWVRSRRNRLVRQHEPSRSQAGLEVVPQ